MQLLFLKGKLAQKIFAFFIVASFLPLLISSYISYQQVSRIIETDSLDNLKSASKEYGLSVFFRLKLAKDTLQNNTDNLLLNKNISAAKSNLFNYFSAVGIRSTSDKHTTLWGYLDKDAFSDNNSKQSLKTIRRTENKKDVYITLSNGIIGKINSKYLWATEIANSENEFCITNIQYSKIFCQSNLSQEDLSEIKHISADNKSKTKKIENIGSETLLTYWPLFLDHEFGVDSWLIIASQSDHITQNRLVNYTQFFLPLLLFSLFLVVLLSSILIRKNLETINQLIIGTRNIISGNFKQKIQPQSDDELAELAHSFNIMAENMGMVINEYKAFSEIDKLILQSVDKERIITSIFSSLENIIHFEEVILLSNEDSKAGLPPLYIRSNKQLETQISSNKSLLYQAVDDLQIKDIRIIEKGEFKTQGSQQVLNGFDQFCVIPIDSETEGSHRVYLLGATNDKVINHLTKEKLAVFASRIAVTFQALEREAALTHKANYDGLTKLPNKNNILAFYQKQKQKKYNDKIFSAVLFIDLDHFKQVNDNYGHSVGDKLLKEFSKRLRSTLGKNDIAGRLSGDEFIIITQAESDEGIVEAISKICRQVISKATQAFYIDNHVLHIGASIGASINPGFQDSFDDILRYADIAMYFSKKKGGNEHTIYNQNMSEELLKQSLLERDLRTAIEHNEIDIHYQPKFSAHERKLTGFEALFRWNHATYGPVSPFIAIEIAESIGIIGELGKLVFRRSIQQWEEWLEKGYAIGTIAVNVSPAQLLEEGFITFVENTLNSAPLIAPDMIEFEITESVMLKDRGASIAVLKQLREIGINIAIDDFGTGYSSLSYLLDLPANTLKIDRAFVTKIEQDPNALALLSSLITLGKNMNYKIVAEGIETEQQATFLSECKTDELQGYLFSKPIPAELVEKRFLNPLQAH